MRRGHGSTYGDPDVLRLEDVERPGGALELLEAIGEKQVGTYFETIDQLLETSGIACVQTILIPDDRCERDRTSPDWIERDGFPRCVDALRALRHVQLTLAQPFNEALG